MSTASLVTTKVFPTNDLVASASATSVSEFLEKSPAKRVKSEFAIAWVKRGDLAKEPESVLGRKSRFGKTGSFDLKELGR